MLLALIKKRPFVSGMIILSLLYWFFSKDIEKMVDMNFNEIDAKNGILEIQRLYGTDMAKIVEKMSRLETRHFKSQQYKLTGSAGMEVGKWSNIPKDSILSTIVKLNDSNLKDGIDSFIVWKSPTEFFKYLAEYIKRYNGNFARWNSLDLTQQAKYRASVNAIKTQFV